MKHAIPFLSPPVEYNATREMEDMKRFEANPVEHAHNPVGDELKCCPISWGAALKILRERELRI